MILALTTEHENVLLHKRHWLPEGAAENSPWMERSAILGKHAKQE
jgi:hypothetical protein